MPTLPKELHVQSRTVQLYQSVSHWLRAARSECAARRAWRAAGRRVGPMPNSDKVKAARQGGDLRYKQKVQGINVAARVAFSNDRRVQGVQAQLRSFEDAGHGVHTGAQYEHEQNMREQKLRRESKAAKAAAFRANVEHQLDVGGDHDKRTGGNGGGSNDTVVPVCSTPSSETDSSNMLPTSGLRFGVGTRVRCRLGPREWGVGHIIQQHYREAHWPAGQLAAYQVRLDDGEMIFAPVDQDGLIQAVTEAPSPTRGGGCEGESLAAVLPGRQGGRSVDSGGGGGENEAGFGASSSTSGQGPVEVKVEASYWY